MKYRVSPFRAWRAMLGRDFRIWRRTLPVLIPFSLIIALFCALAVGTLSKGSESGFQLAKLAVVQEYDTKKGSMMLDLVAAQDFTAPLSITQTDADDAWQGLRAGNYDAIIILPDGYARDISRGHPTQARLVLSRGAALHSKIVEVLADFGETVLTTSQFGIFAGQEVLQEQDSDAVDRYLVVSNTLYVQDAVGALENWFTKEQVSYAGLNLTYINWYVLLYAALFFHLLALFFLPLRQDCSTAVLRRLRTAGVSDGAFVFGKLCLSFLLHALFFAGLCVLLPQICGAALPLSQLPSAILGLFLSACVGTALVLCLHSGAAAAAITALAAVGLFSAGGIIERMELPRIVCEIGDHLPVGLTARLSAGLLGAAPSVWDCLCAVLWCALALLAVKLRLRAVRGGREAMA